MDPSVQSVEEQELPDGLETNATLMATTSTQTVPEEPAPRVTTAARDIGSHVDLISNTGDVTGQELESNLQHHLCNIYDFLGGKQVSRGQIAFYTSWIL